MHNGAAAVTLHMCCKTLARFCPHHLACSVLTWTSPFSQTIKDLPAPPGVARCCKICKGITQAGLGAEVHWHVHEIESPIKAFIFKQLDQLRPCVILGQVPEQHSCFFSLWDDR